jgi:hypothetical protein
MTTDRLTRGRLPTRLADAKKECVERFLSPGTARPAFSALAVSVRPEHNVVGVGVGTKVTGGQKTNRQVIRIYVARKLPREAVPPEHRLPERVGGVPTDVIETGRFRALPATVPLPQRRHRPVKPGCSVGFQFTGALAGSAMAGTFGAIVRAGGVNYVLSNNHVLANENALPIGSPIFQPGLLDSGNPSTDQIARLTRFIPLAPGSANRVDCAIAELLSTVTWRATFLPKVGKLKSAAPIAAAEDMRVMKVGRTTGYRIGTVVDVSADVNVEYDIGVVSFTDQMLIEGTPTRPFSASGDSGSLIVDRDTKRATGLLFAGSATHTIANHISDVLSQLGVTLVV